jgi:hypothetical protein
MRLSRSCPDLNAYRFVDPDEIRATYVLTKTRVPAHSRFNKMLRLAARLGGFLARKGDGEFGAQKIWKGLINLHFCRKNYAPIYPIY